MTAETPLKVMVIDEDPEIPRLLKGYLGRDYLVTGSPSGKEAILAASRELFPVVVLDLHVEGMSGIAILKRLKEICPHQQVVIFTAYASEDDLIDAINFDVFRYLRKPFEFGYLRKAVSEALARFNWEVNMTANWPVTAPHLRSLGLSGRQSEVALGILEGKTNPAIAESLFITSRAVEKHVGKILSRFEISTRHKLADKLREFRRPPHVGSYREQ